jgi:hypothetical protein
MPGQAQGRPWCAAYRQAEVQRLDEYRPGLVWLTLQDKQNALLHPGACGEPPDTGFVGQDARLAQMAQGLVVAAQRRLDRRGGELGDRREEWLILAA